MTVLIISLFNEMFNYLLKLNLYHILLITNSSWSDSAKHQLWFDKNVCWWINVSQLIFSQGWITKKKQKKMKNKKKQKKKQSTKSQIT